MDATNVYEGLFIVRPNAGEDELKGICKTIVDTIATNGGKVSKEDNWGKRVLAYPIKKSKEGYYFKVDFDSPTASISKLRGIFKLNGDILREMITRK